MAERYPWSAIAKHVTVSTAELARDLRVSRRTVFRMRRLGLTDDQCEAVALWAGLWPLDVWPELLHPPTRVCAADGCGVEFVARSARHVHCSQTCGARVRRRRAA